MIEREVFMIKEKAKELKTDEKVSYFRTLGEFIQHEMNLIASKENVEFLEIVDEPISK